MSFCSYIIFFLFCVELKCEKCLRIEACEKSRRNKSAELCNIKLYASYEWHSELHISQNDDIMPRNFQAFWNDGVAYENDCWFS